MAEKTATLARAELQIELTDAHNRGSVSALESVESILKTQGEARAAKIVATFRERLLAQAQAAESDAL